jgi:hypothetical protein
MGHWTPLEHAARAGQPTVESMKLWGNYRGWEQWRKMQPGERRGPSHEGLPFDFGVLDRVYPPGVDFVAEWPEGEP